MTYQRFGKEKSSSDSHSKFQSLKLTTDMIANKNVLDIGCNEGYFTFKMAEMGAKNVIGIDKTNKWIELANKRNTFKNVLFINTDLQYLNTLESHSIDIVLTLSSMHYMCDPHMRDQNDVPLLLIQISRILSNGGIWIFEGGVVENNTENEFIALHRRIGDIVYHPTKTKIQDIIIKTFGSYKYIGPSVNQPGDPVPRFVYYGVK